jgi:hypothetical protein
VIEISSMLVQSFDLDHLDVFWTLKDITPDQNERVEEYDFYVLRSDDGAAGPYRALSSAFYNSFRFRDGNVHLLHKWRTYYYKIKIVHRESGDEKEFGPEWLRAQPDRIALEIQRREGLLFKEKAGRQVLYYPRLTAGPRCGHCWDRGVRGNTIGRQTQQNCATCFDTTFVGGYAYPMQIAMQIDPNPLTPQKTDLTEHQFAMTTARTTAFPPIYAKDLIVEEENKRWRVESVSFTRKHRAIVRQELKLTEYPKDDIKFLVPVNLEAGEFHSTPGRAYDRLMDVQDTPDEPIPDIYDGGPPL